MSDQFPEKCYQDVLTRVGVLEVELRNHSANSERNQASLMQMLIELKQGIGMRVEQGGKDIAVLQEKVNENKKRVESLEATRTWFGVTIIGTFIMSAWNMVLGKK